jgi:hypothetical protein
MLQLSPQKRLPKNTKYGNISALSALQQCVTRFSRCYDVPGLTALLALAVQNTRHII